MVFKKEFKQYVIEFRRDIHSHPETAFHEVRTAGRISEELNKLGIRHVCGIGGTGIIACMGDRSKPCIAFRGDMDGLPVTEIRTSHNSEYRSVNEGVMHACGHDAHISLLIGTARYLAEHPCFLEKSGIQVKLIFQPAEEGGGGAANMIEDGCLEDPEVAAIIGQHVIPDLETGQVGYCRGASHAASDALDIAVRGTGGHGARPEETEDPVVAASYLVTQLQSVVSRSVPGPETGIVTIGKFSAGSKRNVIPGEALLEGTIRSHNQRTRERIHARIREICAGIEASFGVHADVTISSGYPAHINDLRLCDFFSDRMSALLGDENVALQRPSCGSEDFAFYGERVPALIHRLGTRNKEKGLGWDRETGRVIALHNNRFDIDEEALFTGISCFLEWIASARLLLEEYLKRPCARQPD